MPTNPARPTRRSPALVLVTTLAGAALAVLVHARPHLGPESWARGDDLALGVAWGVAMAAAVWLFVVTGACVLALGCSRPHLARHIARILPTGIRRFVEVAIVTAVVAVPAVPAFATPPAPVATVVIADEPVVRAVTPPSTATVPAPPISRRAPTPTTGTVPASIGPRAPVPTSTSVPTPTPTPVPARAVPRTPPRAPSPSTVGSRVVVRPGDNLWLIARAALARTSGRAPTEAEVVHYWRAVITANRTTLRSGHPSLIFPGEIVTVPPV